MLSRSLWQGQKSNDVGKQTQLWQYAHITLVEKTQKDGLKKIGSLLQVIYEKVFVYGRPDCPSAMYQP